MSEQPPPRRSFNSWPPPGHDPSLAGLFRRGDLYADRWPPELRRKLNVPDPLAAVVSAGIQDGLNVVITGNAGDGKSHLAAVALEDARPKSRLDFAAETDLTSITKGTLVFIRDASALPDALILSAHAAVEAAGAQMLITVNEGPLASLASRGQGDFFSQVRTVVHQRAQGGRADDPPRTLIINLAGRQFARGGAVEHLLERLLPNVEGCSTCGAANGSCPRVLGAQGLMGSSSARQRLRRVLSLLPEAGIRLTPRDVWVLLTTLFYGWTCPPGVVPISDRSDGFWWMQLFDGLDDVSELLRAEVDPKYSSDARADGLLWAGKWSEVGLGDAFPLDRPSRLHQEEQPSALRVFVAAKRARFFFDENLDVEAELSSQSPVAEYAELVAASLVQPEGVIRKLVGQINKFRMRESTETELWLSRHSHFSATRRPRVFAASDKVPVRYLELRLPYQHEPHRAEELGFWPPHVILRWRGSEQEETRHVLKVDFDAWVQLRQRRTLLTDRLQESLDAALDLFLGQAPVEGRTDPEILVVDHRERQGTRLKASTSDAERRLEVLS